MKSAVLLVLASVACCPLLCAADKNAAKSLPAPSSEKTYTFQTAPVAVYVQIHVFNDKKAAALSIVLGTHVSVTDGKAVYSW